MELLRKLSGQDEKMQALRNNFEALDSRAADVKTEVEDAESRKGKKRKHEVENWLRNVGRVKNEVQNLERERKISLHLLGNPVDKLNVEIAQLREQGSFQRGLLLDVCATRGESLLATELIGQTVQQNLEKIWACLIDDSKKLRIGICGMGGVGKTSQAVNIHNKLIENSETRDHIFWCTASNDYSIGKLQSDIAKCFDLDLSKENDEKKRAAKLSQAFAMREKCVLFLDDVWDKIDLHRIGIPDGCKLILTTRSGDVCRKMGCKQFKVEPLSKEEAWKLFWEKLCNGEDMALSPEVIDIANSVAAKCDGLPLAIVTMAATMRGVDDICEWRNVFEELKKLTMGHEDMKRDVLPSLELSYSRLNDTKLKGCFLYCALYTEDWKIPRNELIRHFIVEGLIDRSKSLTRKFDEGHTILNKLERSCLLERCKDISGETCVKMHDLIRDMALKITENRFMVKAGVGLKEIPDLQDWAGNLEKVSLMHNNIQEIPCGWFPRCHSLSTLILKENQLVSIAESFFKHMHALQVLDLSNNLRIAVLPNSISDLVNLTALLLAGCASLRYVPPLGKLRALEELDLSFTHIKEVPQGMDMLVNLKHLNMNGTFKLEKIPSGTFTRLSHLQLLGLVRTRVEIQAAEELEGLTKLEEIDVRLNDVHSFNVFLKFVQHREVPLDKCILQLGSGPLIQYRSYSKLISRRGKSTLYFTKGEEDDSFLPYDLEALRIWNGRFTSGCLCDVYPSFWGNARRPQFCEIRNCIGLESILSVCFSSTFSSLSRNEEEIEVDDDQLGESRNAPFQSVQILMLIDLEDLRGLIGWKKVARSRLGFGVIPPHGTFSNLRKLCISNCPKMKSVFTHGLQLPHLEQITIRYCNEIEEIFESELTTLTNNAQILPISAHLTLSELNGLWLSRSLSELVSIYKGMETSDNRCILPKLKKLQLDSLSKLESICGGIMVCDSIEEIYVRQCPRLKRLPLFLPNDNGQPLAPVTLKRINIDDDIDWWESLEWDPPNTKDVLQPFLRFDCSTSQTRLDFYCKGINIHDYIDWWDKNTLEL